MAKIELFDVCKKYHTSERSYLKVLEYRTDKAGGNDIAAFSIDNLNLEIPDMQTMVILGPSGCGKTTILKIIAGLMPVDSGTIKFDGVDVREMNPENRKIGMVFQDYALYPHLTSRINILSYFFFKKKTAELYEQAKEKFDRTSELMGVDIEYLLDRKAEKLSGGEKQRVAIGRCITRDPNVFLLDEPFANLDRVLKDKYHMNVKRLLKKFDVTTVYVTHDQQEALIFADQIAIMNKGKIEQVGTSDDIYNNPKNLFIAEFLNPDITVPAINCINGEYLSRELSDVTVGVRPNDIEIHREQKQNLYSARVTEMNEVPLQKAVIIIALIKDIPVYIKASEFNNISTGDTVWLAFKKYHTFNKQTGKRIKSFL
ncbi:MAG: ABC transporter ATP-binding protein [Spirochaetales bacterium]|nr:ABC transporter ATP-binding protein [Spirochaetales bacterium]